MPVSPPDSSGSPPPSVTSSSSAAALPLGRGRTPRLAPLGWRRNARLFVATVASVFVTCAHFALEAHDSVHSALVQATQFTASLMSILLAHEFGHYIAARIHKVDASLPYFIPLPIISPFGTMGAVIRMRSVIPTRRALLDIGAAGPLAGLALAIPLYAWGIGQCELVRLETLDGMGDSMQFGDSLLTRL